MKNNSSPIPQEAEDGPRTRIINSYLETIDNGIRENRPQIKLVNYGTGSGKTHQLFQAICKTINKYPDMQIIGVYIAPLREHLQVPTLIESQYPEIPIYPINSLEMKTTEDSVKAYKKWIPAILTNKGFWKKSAKNDSWEKDQEARQNLGNAKKVISRLEYIKKSDFGDHEFKRVEITDAMRDLNNFIESFLEFVVKYKPAEKDWPVECVNLMKIFFPLHLLREKSGILMLTYEKFETLIPYFNLSGENWVKKNDYLDRYVSKHTDSKRKFIVAFDEQEDGYQIMLKHKIDIISPKKLAINNALSSINREFSVLFSAANDENRQFLNFIENNPGAFYELQEFSEKGKVIDSGLQKFIPTYNRLTIEEGNSIKFLTKVIELNKGLQKSFGEIAGTFEDYGEENPVLLNFEVLARVFSKFENNRSLLIPQALYSKISDDLMNIFAYNNLYIYNIEPLKKLLLTRPSGGHVHIVEDEAAGNPSVAELIYAILAIRLQIKTIKEFLANVLDAEDSQSRSLDIWSQQIDKAQKASEEGALQNHPIKYLNRAYVYQSYKSIINIMEISRYQFPTNNLIDQSLREVSIGSTAIMTSPERRIDSMLANNGNVVFLISATGGVVGDLSTSYDMRYLEDALRNESGDSSFEAMNEQEILLCEEIRTYRQSKRKITARFFAESLSSFPNSDTREILAAFDKLVLKDFIESIGSEGWSGLGTYKVQELQNFVRFLFYLFEDDEIQETIAFTQTIRWIKQLIVFCEKLHHANFIVEASNENPNVYFFRLRHAKYQSALRIKIVLYEASFNSLYYNKTTEKTYLDELVEADGQKVFFVSAYQSASKGLNPIIKNKKGEQKDFDSLVLLMDSYYTAMGPALYKAQDAGQAVTAYHFSLMKSIVHLGDSNLEIKDFNKYLSQPEAREFQDQQHQILLGKGILQAIGRTERRDFPNQVVKIFINEETRKNLVNFYRYLNRDEPNEIRKLSVNNYEVYSSVQIEEQKRLIENYDEHVYDETEAYLTFQTFRERMLKEIDHFHSDNTTYPITQAWDSLRDPLVFVDPAKYLERLNATGIFPDGFPESLFYQKTTQPEFIPYLATVEEQSKKFEIISDSANGEKVYPYLNRLFPEYLKTYSRGYDLEGNEVLSLDPSTELIHKQYKLLVPQPEIFTTFIPRPQFFYDVLYPSLTENFTEHWIKNVIFNSKDWKSIKSSYGFEPLQDFNMYKKLYELFDLFYLKERTLYCIDVKAWSLASGNRLSQKTLDKAQKKLDTIAKEYPEFSTVRGLLLNLHAVEEKSHQYSPSLFSGNLIYFNDHRFPVESTILRSFLFQKEK